MHAVTTWYEALDVYNYVPKKTSQIAIIGVGVSLAIKAALQKHNVSGEIILLGTPGMLE